MASSIFLLTIASQIDGMQCGNIFIFLLINYFERWPRLGRLLA